MPLSRFLALAVTVGALAGTPALAQNASPPHAEAVKRIMDGPAYKKAVEIFDKEHDRWVEEVIKLTEIEAPPFKEEKRAKVYADMFKAHGLTDVEIDKEGNVLGVRKGTGGPAVVVSAHLDTVFPEGTDVKVQRKGTPPLRARRRRRFDRPRHASALRARARRRRRQDEERHRLHGHGRRGGARGSSRRALLLHERANTRIR